MDKFVNKTADALARFGERIERHLTTDAEEDFVAYERRDSKSGFGGSGSAFQRPLEKKSSKNNYVSKKRDLLYGGARNHSGDHLAASPSGHSSFSNYRQNPVDRYNKPPYGTGIGAPLNYGYQAGYGNAAAAGGFGNQAGNVGYAPDYYIAERRQLELVPAPPPRVIREQVPYPVPVDRPVPQPYPVAVPQPICVDRPVPVPVPVPQPVPVDRPVPVPYPVDRPVPVPVPVPSPPPQPMANPCVNPCYAPVGIPVPSPPPSPPPVMIENSVTYTQRWVTGSPVMMQQQRQLAGSPVMMQQQRQLAGSPVMMMQPQPSYGSQFGGMNPYGAYGNGSYVG
ncbi:unnamed protein product [Adineta ricciae]|uniref:Uncharacterized protein n=1 Tax=Adineta ricciae TaxID=249248 RepID=A0A816DND8_ADIRI|nr:unnamed protein product [Adineta ricciae]CAF1636991.1 unnamed protein product [Adineta ricciae]